MSAALPGKGGSKHASPDRFIRSGRWYAREARVLPLRRSGFTQQRRNVCAWSILPSCFTVAIFDGAPRTSPPATRSQGGLHPFPEERYRSLNCGSQGRWRRDLTRDGSYVMKHGTRGKRAIFLCNEVAAEWKSRPRRPAEQRNERPTAVVRFFARTIRKSRRAKSRGGLP